MGPRNSYTRGHRRVHLSLKMMPHSLHNSSSHSHLQASLRQVTTVSSSYVERTAHLHQKGLLLPSCVHVLVTNATLSYCTGSSSSFDVNSVWSIRKNITTAGAHSQAQPRARTVQVDCGTRNVNKNFYSRYGVHRGEGQKTDFFTSCNEFTPVAAA